MKKYYDLLFLKENANIEDVENATTYAMMCYSNNDEMKQKILDAYTIITNKLKNDSINKMAKYENTTYSMSKGQVRKEVIDTSSKNITSVKSQTYSMKKGDVCKEVFNIEHRTKKVEPVIKQNSRPNIINTQTTKKEEYNFYKIMRDLGIDYACCEEFSWDNIQILAQLYLTKKLKNNDNYHNNNSKTDKSIKSVYLYIQPNGNVTPVNCYYEGFIFCCICINNCITDSLVKKYNVDYTTDAKTDTFNNECPDNEHLFSLSEILPLEYQFPEYISIETLINVVNHLKNLMMEFKRNGKLPGQNDNNQIKKNVKKM